MQLRSATRRLDISALFSDPLAALCRTDIANKRTHMAWLDRMLMVAVQAHDTLARVSKWIDNRPFILIGNARDNIIDQPNPILLAILLSYQLGVETLLQLMSTDHTIARIHSADVIGCQQGGMHLVGNIL